MEPRELRVDQGGALAIYRLPQLTRVHSVPVAQGRSLQPVSFFADGRRLLAKGGPDWGFGIVDVVAGTIGSWVTHSYTPASFPGRPRRKTELVKTCANTQVARNDRFVAFPEGDYNLVLWDLSGAPSRRDLCRPGCYGPSPIVHELSLSPSGRYLYAELGIRSGVIIEDTFGCAAQGNPCDLRDLLVRFGSWQCKQASATLSILDPKRRRRTLIRAR